MTDRQTIWVNGQLHAAEQAHISAMDKSFLLGHGAFETLRTYGTTPFALHEHWSRLCFSCQKLGLPAPEEARFTEAIQQAIEANRAVNARLRFTVGAGAQNTTQTTLTAFCTELPPRVAEASIALVPWPLNERSPLAGVKCTSYAENLLALEWARAHGAHEGIYINTQGNIAEGTTSNIFLVRRGKVLTPSLDSGCLAGVTRGIVIALARSTGIPCAECSLPAASLDGCDEIFLTSTTRELQPVCQIDGVRPLQAPGPVTAKLANAFRDLAA